MNEWINVVSVYYFEIFDSSLLLWNQPHANIFLCCVNEKKSCVWPFSRILIVFILQIFLNTQCCDFDHLAFFFKRIIFIEYFTFNCKIYLPLSINHYTKVFAYRISNSNMAMSCKDICINVSINLINNRNTVQGKLFSNYSDY